MPGIQSLRRLQIGRESTAGTAVAATAKLRALGMIEDRREVVFPDENVGYVGGTDRSYIPKLLAGLEMEEVPATFEQILYLLEGGIKAVQTGSADGSGSGKIYSYTLPSTAVNTFNTFTLEAGDDQQEEEMEYSFVEEIKLSGKAGEALMMSGAWLGRQVAASTFTGSIALPTVEEVLFGKGKLYIDPVTGTNTYGGTIKSNTFVGLDLSIKTGIIPVFTDGGNLYFNFAKMTRPVIEMDITFEHDAVATAEKTAWRAQTARLIRLNFEGNSLTTAGTSYSVKTLRIDLAGKWQTFEKIGENNGNDIVTGKFISKFNATANAAAGDWGKIIVVNELSALP